ncbi:hypothetical protein ONZ45_g3933 [Pleurotus djamor]|nr:hypothetical protein ONZ45_g3933 [Pleurotus djamor]
MTPLAQPEFLNTIELVTSETSKIEKVSLYSGRAEVTRVYQLEVKTGQNQVKISGLPNVLDNDSLRVEGRGKATIQGVTVAFKTPSRPETTSETLEALQDSKRVTEKAISRCKKAISSLEVYLSSLKATATPGLAAWEVLDGFEQYGEKLDSRSTKLQSELQKINEDIEKEEKLLALGNKAVDTRLCKAATVDLFADVEGPVTLVLIYAVSNANWEAVYDIRVDMNATKEPIKLTYKAGIIQTTGESWDDVSLVLETVKPTFGVELPTLRPWRISVSRPEPRDYGKSRSRFLRASTSSDEDEEEVHYVDQYSSAVQDANFAKKKKKANMQHREAVVTNKGNLSTSFSVPGLVSIPSRLDSQSITITQLSLDATMHWLTLPRAEAKVHLKATIKNTSQFPLIPGLASIYVDGSFISKTRVPASNPQESFDCPLGPDPSIRVTYHPLSKKLTEGGFYSKHFSRVFTQQITVQNTKAIPVNDLTIVDHIPISEDSQITVKLIEPELTLPGKDKSTLISKSTKSPPEKPTPVVVSKGVTAIWDGADDPENDVRSLGQYGRIAWKCVIPEQDKVNVNLIWEVNTPSKVAVGGL